MTDIVRDNKRMAKENVDPLPGGKRDLVTEDMKKTKVLDVFSYLSFHWLVLPSGLPGP